MHIGIVYIESNIFSTIARQAAYLNGQTNGGSTNPVTGSSNKLTDSVVRSTSSTIIALIATLLPAIVLTLFVTYRAVRLRTEAIENAKTQVINNDSVFANDPIDGDRFGQKFPSKYRDSDNFSGNNQIKYAVDDKENRDQLKNKKRRKQEYSHLSIGIYSKNFSILLICHLIIFECLGNEQQVLTDDEASISTTNTSLLFNLLNKMSIFGQANDSNMAVSSTQTNGILYSSYEYLSNKLVTGKDRDIINIRHQKLNQGVIRQTFDSQPFAQTLSPGLDEDLEGHHPSSNDLNIERKRTNRKGQHYESINRLPDEEEGLIGIPAVNLNQNQSSASSFSKFAGKASSILPGLIGSIITVTSSSRVSSDISSDNSSLHGNIDSGANSISSDSGLHRFNADAEEIDHSDPNLQVSV